MMYEEIIQLNFFISNNFPPREGIVDDCGSGSTICSCCREEMLKPRQLFIHLVSRASCSDKRRKWKSWNQHLLQSNWGRIQMQFYLFIIVVSPLCGFLLIFIDWTYFFCFPLAIKCISYVNNIDFPFVVVPIALWPAMNCIASEWEGEWVASGYRYSVGGRGQDIKGRQWKKLCFWQIIPAHKWLIFTIYHSISLKHTLSPPHLI